MANWLSLFAVYRVVVIRNDEVTQGVLHPGLGPDAPEVRAALAEWEGTHFLHQGDAGTEVMLVRPVGGRRPERWWLHALLWLPLTAAATLGGLRAAKALLLTIEYRRSAREAVGRDRP